MARRKRRDTSLWSGVSRWTWSESWANLRVRRLAITSRVRFSGWSVEVGPGEAIPCPRRGVGSGGRDCRCGDCGLSKTAADGRMHQGGKLALFEIEKVESQTHWRP